MTTITDGSKPLSRGLLWCMFIEWVCEASPALGICGCWSSRIAPVSVRGAFLLLGLILPLAAWEEGDACVVVANAGSGREATLILRCAACSLTAARYLAALACSGSISASRHASLCQQYMQITCCVPYTRCLRRLQKHADTWHDLSADSSSVPCRKFIAMPPIKVDTQDAGLTQCCLKVCDSPGKVALVCKGSPSSNMCIHIPSVKLQSSVISLDCRLLFATLQPVQDVTLFRVNVTQLYTHRTDYVNTSSSERAVPAIWLLGKSRLPWQRQSPGGEPRETMQI